jgi:hypothetical protein
MWRQADVTYEDQAAGWACGIIIAWWLEDCNPNGRLMILRHLIVQGETRLPISGRWPLGLPKAVRGLIIRTCLEISKTPEVGSNLSGGVAA